MDRHWTRGLRSASPALLALAVGTALPAGVHGATPAEGAPRCGGCASPVLTLPVHSDHSPPLVVLPREGNRSPAARVRRSAENARLARINAWRRASGPALAVAADAGGGVLTGETVPEPSFAATALVDTSNPADPTGAAGPDHYVHLSNGGMTVWSVEGELLFRSEFLPFLWAGFGGLCEQFVGDPYVAYDALDDRWLIGALSYGNLDLGPFLQCVAVSQSGDPLGAWHRYAWSFEKLNDFPKFGVWPDAYTMTFNGVPPPHGVVVLERDRLLAGDPAARMLRIDLDHEVWGVHTLVTPADPEGPNPPPAGAAQPILGMRRGPSFYFDRIDVLELHVDWDHPDDTTLVRSAEILLQPVEAYRRGPYHRVAYRNSGAFETMAFAVEMHEGDDLDLEWFQLRRRAGGGWTLWRHGLYDPDDGFEWTPAAATDAAGNLAVSFQRTARQGEAPPSDLVPSLQYSGRLPADPPGLLREPRTLVASAVPDPSGRFGDYTSVVVHPSDDCTFWLAGEYVRPGDLFTLTDVHIGTFSFPSCPDQQAPQTQIATAPPLAGAPPTALFTFTSSEPASVFDCALDDVPFAPCASPASYAGLAGGSHTFRARAVDSAANVDASPAAWTWTVGGEGDPPPPSATWASTPALPGFGFQVRVTSPGGVVPTRQESDCLDETICFSGAVAGRSELFVRVVGPRPNGYLWPNVVKFSTSQIEAWIRRDTTGAVRYYLLPAALPGSNELAGLFDRLGFLAAGSTAAVSDEAPWVSTSALERVARERATSDPPPPGTSWMATPALPGFRFQTRITAAGGVVVATRQEADCLPETLCVSGALPGRSELFLRIVGPRPNGYLWPHVVKFSTSRIEVWIEQTSGGEVRYYDLPAAAADSGLLTGLFDRQGFVP